MSGKEIRFVDTTIRDGHQSLWASSMTTGMMLPVAERHRERHGNDRCRDGKKDGVRESRADQLRDFPLVGERRSEITLQEIPEPLEIPGMRRQIEPELPSERRHRLRRRRLSQHRLGKIARQRFDTEENEQRDNNQRQEAERQTFENQTNKIRHATP